MGDGIRELESKLFNESQKAERQKAEAHYSDVKDQQSFRKRFEEATKNISPHNSLFRAHECSESQRESINEVRELFTYLYRNLNSINSLESSRLGAITKSKLEEACMFAIKNIAEGSAL